ncbi:helix-turn-helix domain-containing protein [Corynebacterium sanguinis]
MPAPKRITDEQRQQIINLRKRGWTLREVAQDTGVSVATVSRTLRAAGIDTNPTYSIEAATARWEQAKAAAYEVLSDLLDDVESLRQRMYEPWEQWVTTPDGPAKVTLPEPPLGEVARIADQMRRTAVEIQRLQQEIDNGSSLDRTRGVLHDLFEGFKMVAALAEPINGDGTYDSDYDIETDPEQR